MDTKTVALVTLAALASGGTVYYSTDDGATLEKVALEAVPVTDELVKVAPKDCADAIKLVGDDPQCSVITAHFPRGGDIKAPPLVYDEDGNEIPPTLKELRTLYTEAREVWACNGAVMPTPIQGCLDDAVVSVAIAAEEAAIAAELAALAAAEAAAAEPK